MKNTHESVQPVAGAARYFAAGNDVYMVADGHESCIQCCRSIEAAQKAAVRWQIKENKVVTKYSKTI